MTRPHSPPRVPLCLVVLVLIAGVACSASACSGSDDTGRPQATVPPSSTAVATPESSTSTSLGTDGSQIFAARCAACHGAGGQGYLGPPLVGIADRMSVEDQIALVAGGRGTMPAFSAGLTVEQIQAVVEYTRTRLG